MMTDFLKRLLNRGETVENDERPSDEDQRSNHALREFLDEKKEFEAHVDYIMRVRRDKFRKDR